MSKEKEFGPCPECGHPESHGNLWPGTDDHHVRECDKCDFYCHPAMWNSQGDKCSSAMSEIEKVVQVTNTMIAARDKDIKRFKIAAILFAIFLIVSWTVNIIMVINNIGGLK